MSTIRVTEFASKAIVGAILMMVIGLSGCHPSNEDPNVLYTDDHKNPLKKLEVEKEVDSQSMPYQKTFYVPVYSNIHVDEDNPKVLLSTTLSIRNTSLEHALYVKKIDYYNTTGDFVRPFLEKTIKLPPMGTLNYIVEKLDDTGGDGANFVVELEGSDTKLNPIIETIMIGNYSNKGFAFTSTAVPIEPAKQAAP